MLDADDCYRVVQSKDTRFDGRFVTAVLTTGIYCRPSCPAVTPKRENVLFFATAAAAQQRGFRACKRCRPDASPGTPEWDVRGDVVARAMRLVADGVVDREGVAGLARRLAFSERHLNRLITAELGAGPLAIARAQRAETARVLIETTDMAFTAVAFASGFGSVRQFNDTVRDVYAASPTALREAASRRGDVPRPPGVVSLELAVREPFDAPGLFEFFAARAIPGVEAVVDGAYHRTLDLPHGHGVVALRPGRSRTRRRAAIVHAELRLQDWRDLGPAVRRVRRLLDLDADPVAVDEQLASDPALGAVVAATPGRRVPGSVDAFETAVRAVVGQQISVAGARTIVGRIVAAVGDALAIDGGDHLTHVFPRSDAVAGIDPEVLAMPWSRRRTLVELAARCADGRLDLSHGAERDVARAQLLDVPGIGPWTAGYVLMRGLGDPDVFLPTDLGVRHGLAALGLDAECAERWRPWRSYALHHLWSIDPAAPPVTRLRPAQPMEAVS